MRIITCVGVKGSGFRIVGRCLYRVYVVSLSNVIILKPSSGRIWEHQRTKPAAPLSGATVKRAKMWKRGTTRTSDYRVS